jgi:ankyrin repeat protein
MSLEDRSRFERHLHICGSCRQITEGFKRTRYLVNQSGEKEFPLKLESEILAEARSLSPHSAPCRKKLVDYLKSLFSLPRFVGLGFATALALAIYFCNIHNFLLPGTFMVKKADVPYSIPLKPEDQIATKQSVLAQSSPALQKKSTRKLAKQTAALSTALLKPQAPKATKQPVLAQSSPGPRKASIRNPDKRTVILNSIPAEPEAKKTVKQPVMAKSTSQKSTKKVASVTKPESAKFSKANLTSSSDQQIAVATQPPKIRSDISALMNAAVNGHNQTIQTLLDDGIGVNAKTRDGKTALMYAVLSDHIDSLQVLLNRGADINAKDNNGVTALIYAVADNNTNIVQTLLDKGADVNVKNNNGATALFYAAEGNLANIVRLLLDQGADIDAKDNNGVTALIYAVADNNTNIVQTLLDRGADVNIKNNNGITALFYAAESGHVNILQTLLTNGADGNVTSNNGATALSYAAENGKVSIVRILLDNGVGVNAKTNNGKTPLIRAAIKGHYTTVKKLLDKGADIDIKDNDGATTLMYAVKAGNSNIMKMLLDKGADITALIYAAEGGNSYIMKMLLDKGVDVNTTNNEGLTALMYAAKEGNGNIVKMLLDNNANINAKTNDGMTALTLTVIAGHYRIVHTLLDRGADINAKDNYGATALFYAAKSGNTNIVKTLLDKDADVNIKDNSGMTALMWAENNDRNGTRMLLSKSDNRKSQVSSYFVPDTSIAAEAPVEKWAVIIGISSYKDYRIPSLQYASSDAQEFYDWIVAPGGGKYDPSKVKLLLNKEATGRNIREALFSWLKQAIKEDLVTIYFAGHGSPESPNLPDNLYLLPFDTEYDKVASTGFPMWDIETALRRHIKAERVVIIADACHAGGIGKPFNVALRSPVSITGNSISTGLKDLSEIGSGICIISASDNRQYSQESKKWGGGHGVFTYYLLKALNGEADRNMDKRIVLSELIPFLSRQIRRATKNSQTPIVSGKFDSTLSIGK